MNVALIYRGFYKRDEKFLKKNNYDINILKNHLESINSLGVKKIDIYFHTYSFNMIEDDKLISLLKKFNLKYFIIDKNYSNQITNSIIQSLQILDREKIELNTILFEKIPDFNFDLKSKYIKNIIKYFNIKKNGKYNKLIEIYYKQSYDLIINTRFDIIFIKKLNEFNIDKNKLNFCFKDLEEFWTDPNLRKVSDLIYIYHPKYNNILKKALYDSQNLDYNSSGHFIYNYLEIDKRNINFMIEGFYSSNTDEYVNEYLYIKRN